MLKSTCRIALSNPSCHNSLIYYSIEINLQKQINSKSEKSLQYKQSRIRTLHSISLVTNGNSYFVLNRSKGSSLLNWSTHYLCRCNTYNNKISMKNNHNVKKDPWIQHIWLSEEIPRAEQNYIGLLTQWMIVVAYFYSVSIHVVKAIGPSRGPTQNYQRMRLLCAYVGLVSKLCWLLPLGYGKPIKLSIA